MSATRLWALTALVMLLPLAARAADPQWRIVKPSNTGIPGEEVRFVRFAPDGRLWVGARWPFWHEGGVGIYDFGTQAWTAHANWETPIPSEYVNDIAFAPGGVVWAATDGGLVKKDSENWTVYTTATAPFLHNAIANIDVDQNGHLWVNNASVTTSLGALFEFDGKTWKKYLVGAELPWAPPWYSLSEVIVDHLNHVWVANEVLNGVAEYDGKTWKLYGADVGRFGEIKEDRDGNIWLRAGVGGGNAFWKFDRVKFTMYPASTTPTAIGVDNDGAVYLGDWYGKVVKTVDSGQTWSLFTIAPGQAFNIEPDPGSNDVWIGTNGSLYHYDAFGAIRDAFNTYNTGLPWYWIDNMYTDGDGNLWFATGEAGASRFDGLRWRNWGAHNLASEPWPFLAEQAFGLYQDSEDYHWIGSNGVGRLDATLTTLEMWDWKTAPFGVTLFRYFAEDMNHTLFAMSEYGSTFRFDRTTQTWSKEPVQPYAVLGLPGVATDSQGQVWIAAWFDIHKWDGSAWTKVALPYPDYFFDLGGINALAIGPDEVMWLGTNEGLVRWDGKTFAVFDTSSSPLPAKEVQGIAVRSDGVIGLSAHEFGSVTPFPSGVAVIDGDVADPASWQVYKYGEAPLPHYQLGRVNFDAQGNLWISCLSEGCAVLLTGSSGVAGDLNCDGKIGAFDIDPFVLALTDPAGYAALYPDCDRMLADINGDGEVDAFDIDPFVKLLTGG